MTETELEKLLSGPLSQNPEGIYYGEFDLDSRGNDFKLWLDGDTEITIPLPSGTDPKEVALLIQKVVRKLGRELFHTWADQYSVNP